MVGQAKGALSHRAGSGVVALLVSALGTASLALPAASQPTFYPPSQRLAGRSPQLISLSEECLAPRVSGPAIEPGDLRVDTIRINAGAHVAAIDLAPETQDLIGRTVSATTLARLADRVTCVYQGRGIVSAVARVSPGAAQGVWSLDINEGRVGSVVIEAADAETEGYLRTAFRGVRQGGPLRAQDLRAGLQSAADLGVHGVSLQAEATTDDPSVLDLVILSGRSPAPAPVDQGVLTLTASSGSSAREIASAAAAQSPAAQQPPGLGIRRTLADLRRSLRTFDDLDARTEYEEFEFVPVESLREEIQGIFRVRRFEVAKPLAVAADSAVTARAGLVASIHREQDPMGPIVGLDRQTVAYFGLKAEHRGGEDGQDSESLDLSVRQGLEAGGASRPGDRLMSRPAADPQGTTFRGKGSLRRHFGGGVVEANVRGQWADAIQLGVQRFNFETQEDDRFLDGDTLTGDRGVSVDLRWIGAAREFSGVTMSPLAFVTAARTWNEGPPGERRRQVALGGGGLRLRLGRLAQLDVVYARRVGHGETGGERFAPRVMITLSRAFGGR